MYARGKYGVEYTPPKPKPESSWLARALLIAAAVGVVLAIRAIYLRIRSGEESEGVSLVVETPADARPAPTNGVPNKASAKAVVMQVDYSNRPVKVRNLLLRLAEADRQHNVEMAIGTIEQLRATPGAADLDDMLARRLGTMNLSRLFDSKSAQWTTIVTVKRGDTASRIAYEHGSTFASLVKLNGSVDKLRVGQTLVVMNHPRFNLVVSRRTHTADLSLNGKFFKRYDLTGEVRGADGSYAMPERFRDFCNAQGVPFKPLDRAELEMLLPKGAAIFIKDL